MTSQNIALNSYSKLVYFVLSQQDEANVWKRLAGVSILMGCCEKQGSTQASTTLAMGLRPAKEVGVIVTPNRRRYLYYYAKRCQVVNLNIKLDHFNDQARVVVHLPISFYASKIPLYGLETR